MKPRSTVLNDIVRLKHLFDLTKVNFMLFLLPLTCSSGAALFEGASIGLLVPFVKGIFERDYLFLTGIPALQWALSALKISRASFSSIFALLLTVIFVAAVAKCTLQFISYFVLDKIIYRFMDRLRCLLFQRYLMFGKQYYDQTSIGYMTNVMLNLVGKVTATIHGLNRPITACVMLIAYIILMFIISWKMTLVCFLIFPILHSVVNLLIIKIQLASGRASELQNILGAKLSNAIMGIQLVKAYTNENVEKNRFDHLSSRIARLEFGMGVKGSMISSVQEIMIIATFLFLASVMAVISVKHGADIAGLLVFFLVLRRAMNSIGLIGQARGLFARLHGPIEEISSFLQDEGKYIMKDGRREFAGLRESIEFKEVSFGYKSDRIIFKRINLSMKKGSSTAIIGSTGSGKTSIANMIMRYYDVRTGQILFDGIDIREFTMSSLRAHIALVSQDIALFNDTLRENLLYGIQREVSERELTAAMKRARIYDFVMSLPDRDKTVIGDRGVQLSGGEKQRIAIARAILKNAEILIFDEATSALDSKTENMVQEAIEEARREKTAIVIAHRLNSIRNSDRIIVLGDGKVSEEGTWQELMLRKGELYEFWRKQGQDHERGK